MGLIDKFFKKKEDDFPPRPKWRPNTPVDIDLVFNKTKYYTSAKAQFAVFQYGTVVYFSNQVESVKDSAISSLGKIYTSHPDFQCMPMDDENYLIEYSHPAFTIVFKEEIENHWDYIDKNHQDGLCRKEVLINEKGQHNVFDTEGKICLFGRAKMFMDAGAPKISRIFDPYNL